MCGGLLNIDNNEKVATCEFCGTKQTIPDLSEEKIANLIDRANHLRRNNEFDKASTIYEQILSENKEDAEIYWSIVLCRYGIDYVEDPKTHKRIPTVNRAQFESVFSDTDYKSAIKYADSSQKKIYEEEAEKIDEIQKGILEISSKEKPFDVFICYKESDNHGRRSIDSVLAQNIYYELTNEGYKVFFSRITLEDKLGVAYEPYIFAALNSAKVMIVLGTCKENFESVWVKNEWSRYLSLIEKGQKKTLIPAYKDMSPYDLPEEFGYIQAQDMSKIGFMQDLLHGVNKLIVKKPVIKEIVGTEESLLKRGFMFLEDGNFDEANNYFEKTLDINPVNAQAYLGKLMAEYKVSKQSDLGELKKPFNRSKNYQKIMKHADEELSEEIQGYINRIVKRKADEIYSDAVRVMNNAATGSDVSFAMELFEKISGYRDADALKRKCQGLSGEVEKNNIYNSALTYMGSNNIDDLRAAVNKFVSLDGYKDSKEKIIEIEEKISRIEKDSGLKNRAFVIAIFIIAAMVIALFISNNMI